MTDDDLHKFCKDNKLYLEFFHHYRVGTTIFIDHYDEDYGFTVDYSGRKIEDIIEEIKYKMDKINNDYRNA